MITFIDKSGGKKEVYLPESKIGTFNDLSRVFNQLPFDCKISVQNSGGKSNIGLANGILKICSRLAKCFRILTKSNQISSLLKLINSNVATISIESSNVVIDGSAFPSNKEL